MERMRSSETRGSDHSVLEEAEYRHAERRVTDAAAYNMASASSSLNRS